MAGPNGKSSDAAPQSNGIWEPVTLDGEAVRPYNVFGLQFFIYDVYSWIMQSRF